MYDDDDYDEYEDHENEEYGGVSYERNDGHGSEDDGHGSGAHENGSDDDEQGSEANGNDAVANKNYAGFVPFVGEGFPATCSGRCLCRYYSPKSPYNTDCACCGHALSYHRPR